MTTGTAESGTGGHAMDWGGSLVAQLGFYWDAHLRPRLEGLTDAEYRWEPVAGSWGVTEAAGGDTYHHRGAMPAPIPPVTTIGWRMAHITIDVMGVRAGAFFGDIDLGDTVMFDRRYWPEPPSETAAGAVDHLERAYTAWRNGIAGLDADDLARPLGPKGGPFAESAMAELILHISREVMHHGAEICLLRDLYRAYAIERDPIAGAAFVGDASAIDRASADDPVAVDRTRAEHPDLLRQAAGRFAWDAVQTLARLGFEVDAGPDGSPGALHYAAGDGDLDAVRFLVDHGADPERRETTFGAIPLGWAVYFDHHQVAAYLRDL